MSAGAVIRQAGGQALDQIDLAAEWAAVADTLKPRLAAPEPAPTRAALGAVMARPTSRRDLRRLLMVIGAIGKPRRGPDASGRTARTSDVVGALITLPEEVLAQLMRSAGAISAEERVTDFAHRIHLAGRQCTLADPAQVAEWVSTVAGILRDEPGY